MAFGSKGGGSATGITVALLALAGLAGTCASLYAMVVAYLAGSSAQAAIDGCPAADPMSLARASMVELGQSVGPQEADVVINVDESDVVVADAQRRDVNAGRVAKEGVA